MEFDTKSCSIRGALQFRFRALFRSAVRLSRHVAAEFVHVLCIAIAGRGQSVPSERYATSHRLTNLPVSVHDCTERTNWKIGAADGRVIGIGVTF